MPKILVILLASIGTIVVLVSLSALVSRIFVASAIRKLINSVGKEPLPHFSSELARKLPEPVRRYLHYALKEGQANIRYAVLQQTARFRHRPGSPWFTVKAKEVLSGMEPGFVWDATLKHNAAWWRTAKLSYMHGTGHGHLKLFGALTLQEYEGPETDTSMLFRFLSELVWLPTGLLPTNTLQWEEIDASTARAVITDGETQVQATFHVNDIGEVDRIVTGDKYRDHKSGFEQATFTLHCRNYREIDGVMIPTEVDFVWNLDSGDFEYGQFNVTDVVFYYE
ncbi:MAG: hypothetical protein IPF59_07045 [Ignavibacteria bacterium]|nr:hypothetical protein [Ignavibacteria bacterium]